LAVNIKIPYICLKPKVMNKQPFFIALLAIAGICFSACNTKNTPRIKTGGAEIIGFRALQFDMDNVKLLDGPFKKATELNEQALLNYEPDRFLAKFRSEAGLEPKAEHYHGWEDNTIAGHSLGHYLTAICLMYKSTGNEELLQRANYIVDELAECQNADGNGYIGAFPGGKRILEEEVARGDIRSKGFDLNGIWVPYYTQHKIMDGLFHAWKLCENKKALIVSQNFADWLYTVVEDLNDDQIQEMLNCEHGGINEALAELYAVTGNEKYLEMSRIFHHKAILDSLANGKDILPGKHANTQIPKLVGTARRYELTGDENDRRASEFFWDRVVNHHSYVTGGNCNHEYFGPPDTLRNRLSDETTETCNVYNMLKLSEHLFSWDARPDVADFYERALFNHILSSQHPKDGRVIYNLSLEMGGFKIYQDPEWFTCCVGSGMENHSKYSRNIYYHNQQELFISQFIASELTWKEKGLVLTQHTQFPEEQSTTFHFICENPVELTLQIRYPYWAENGMEITVNGNAVKVKEQPGSFVAVKRQWENGDRVEARFPYSLRLETMPDDSNRVALMYGPLVLSGDLGPEDDPNASDPLYVPVLMTETRNPENWTNPVPGKTNTFITQNTGRPTDVLFKPFYLTHERRYSVYFDLFTEEQWNQHQEEYQARQEQMKMMESRTIDFFQLGEMQPERNHNFKSEKTWVNEHKHKNYREADRGGWFSFDMDVIQNEPVELAFEYWGGFPGSKTFDILVNGEKLATENISNAKPGEFYHSFYDLPAGLPITGGKVEVKLVPHEGHRAGPLFSVRTMRK